jgi:hypothetical protein
MKIQYIILCKNRRNIVFFMNTLHNMTCNMLCNTLQDNA